MEEIWKEIPGYEGCYEVSNQGRVRSLDRETRNGKCSFIRKGRLINGSLNSFGYKTVSLRLNNNLKSFLVHQLVAIAFLNHKPDGYKIVVDHINCIKTDNRLENLQLISNRENISKDRKNGSSKYTGVSWNKQRNKWRSNIQINGKNKHLGYFNCETAAFLAYQAELSKISVKN